MTSDVNDAATRSYFKKNNHFGCNPADVFFFQQGMMPAFYMDGELLLGEKDSLALSPDGHGGSLRALDRSGALADMQKRGIEHLSYFQVDNPLVYCIDPLFIGLHDLTASEMSSKTISKAARAGKSRQFRPRRRRCAGDRIQRSPRRTGKTNQRRRQPAIQLRLHRHSCAGESHLFDRLNHGGELKLPWHRAEKKVAYVDAAGDAVKPEKPNAVKLEQFVFDAIPLAKNAIVYETDRAEEFSPVKNAEGADSPATCRRDQIRRPPWLAGAGVEVSRKEREPDAALEISPLYAKRRALAERDIAAQFPHVPPGASIYLGAGDGGGLEKFETRIPEIRMKSE